MVIRKIEAEFQDVFHQLYAAYRNTVLDMGSDAVSLQSSSEMRSYYVHMDLRKFTGMKLLNFRLSLKNNLPAATLLSTTAVYDAAREQSRRDLQILVQYATVTKSVIMLSRELMRKIK